MRSRACLSGADLSRKNDRGDREQGMLPRGHHRFSLCLMARGVAVSQPSSARAKIEPKMHLRMASPESETILFRKGFRSIAATRPTVLPLFAKNSRPGSERG